MQNSQQSEYWDIYPIRPRYVKKFGGELNLDVLNSQYSTNFDADLLNSKVVRRPYHSLFAVINQGLQEDKTINNISAETGLSFSRVQTLFKQLIKQRLDQLRSHIVYQRICILKDEADLFSQIIVNSFAQRLREQQNMSFLRNKTTALWEFLVNNKQTALKKLNKQQCLLFCKLWLEIILKFEIVPKQYSCSIQNVLNNSYHNNKIISDHDPPEETQKNNGINADSLRNDIDVKIVSNMCGRLLMLTKKRKEDVEALCKDYKLNAVQYLKKINFFSSAAAPKQTLNQYLGQFASLEEQIVICKIFLKVLEQDYPTYIKKTAQKNQKFKGELYSSDSKKLVQNIKKTADNIEDQIRRYQTQNKLKDKISETNLKEIEENIFIQESQFLHQEEIKLPFLAGKPSSREFNQEKKPIISAAAIQQGEKVQFIKEEANYDQSEDQLAKIKIEELKSDGTSQQGSSDYSSESGANRYQGQMKIEKIMKPSKKAYHPQGFQESLKHQNSQLLKAIIKKDQTIKKLKRKINGPQEEFDVCHQLVQKNKKKTYKKIQQNQINIALKKIHLDTLQSLVSRQQAQLKILLQENQQLVKQLQSYRKNREG